MPKSIPYDCRRLIVREMKAGFSPSEVAERLGYSKSGVKKIWYAYKKHGDQALQTQYHKCGRSSEYGVEIREQVEQIRNNKQGASYVRSKLEQQHPNTKMPSERTLQIWWSRAGTARKRGRPRSVEKNVGVDVYTKFGKSMAKEM